MGLFVCDKPKDTALSN